MKKAILILGPTGAGKSSIIAVATGQRGIVGDSMESCTMDIKSYDVFSPDTQETIALIDTRGFNDSSGISDIDLCLDLATYISRHVYQTGEERSDSGSRSRQRFVLSGVLYLHSIKETKFTSTANTNLSLLKALVGKGFYPRVVLTTTMWDNLPPKTTLSGSTSGPGNSIGLDKFELRQRELDDRIWRDLLDGGARSVRFDGTPLSVWDMVTPLLFDQTPPLIQLLRELAIDGHLGSTSAGKIVCEKIRKKEQKWRERLRDLDENRESDGDTTIAERRETEDQLLEIQKQLDVLDIQLPNDGARQTQRVRSTNTIKKQFRIPGFGTLTF